MWKQILKTKPLSINLRSLRMIVPGNYLLNNNKHVTSFNEEQSSYLLIFHKKFDALSRVSSNSNLMHNVNLSLHIRNLQLQWFIDDRQTDISFSRCTKIGVFNEVLC